MQTNKGFTLIELMVTIVVLAIISMMAAPSMLNTLRKNEVNNEIRKLIYVLQETKDEAISSRSTKLVKVPVYDINDPKFATWEVSDDAENIEFNLMGYLKSDNSICLTLSHKKNTTLKGSILIERNGAITKAAADCKSS